MKKTHRRPHSSEYGPYYNTYISKVEGNDAIGALKKGKTVVTGFLKKIPKSKWEHRYGPGKWTVKEVMVHLIDAERVFAYRALRAARGDKTALPGFEQDDFVAASNANDRTPASILAEYNAVRAATILLFSNLDETAMDRIGKASNHPVSPLAAAFIIAGHEIHHLTIIRDKYL